MASQGGNLQRSTPGRLLLVWAIMMAGLVFMAWRLWAMRDAYTWNEWPTGLGDRDYYSALSANDYYTPALVLPGHDKGLFRRTIKPATHADGRMERLTRDASGRVWVYRDSAHPEKAMFLKAADDQYVEFGERKFWPEYEPPKAIPVSPP